MASISLGAIKSKPSASKNKELPILPGDEVQAKMVDELLKQAEREKSAKAGKEVLQAQFKDLSRPFIFNLNHAKSAVQTTIVALGTDGSELQIALKDAYPVLDNLDEVKLIIGEKRALQFFDELFEIKISSKSIPKDMQQSVVDKIVAVAQEYGCADALQASSTFKPKSTFAAARHSEFTVEENLQLEQINGGKGLTTMSVAEARGRK
jgi:hypothetical protein